MKALWIFGGRVSLAMIKRTYRRKTTFETDSRVVMRVRILSVKPMRADSAGTKLREDTVRWLDHSLEKTYLPMCAMYTISAT